jgi:hypothetical protein
VPPIVEGFLFHESKPAPEAVTCYANADQDDPHAHFRTHHPTSRRRIIAKGDESPMTIIVSPLHSFWAGLMSANMIGKRSSRFSIELAPVPRGFFLRSDEAKD